MNTVTTWLALSHRFICAQSALMIMPENPRKPRLVYGNFGNFCEAFLSRNFACAKFLENKILVKWRNHFVDY